MKSNLESTALPFARSHNLDGYLPVKKPSVSSYLARLFFTWRKAHAYDG
jgi:hypothetical protein